MSTSATIDDDALEATSDLLLEICNLVRHLNTHGDDNPLVHAPHTAEAVTVDEWSHPYPRQLAAYPAVVSRRNKIWPPVARIEVVAVEAGRVAVGREQRGVCEDLAEFGVGGRNRHPQHRGIDDHFARGAVHAAAWLLGREPGLYPIEQVLGLD